MWTNFALRRTAEGRPWCGFVRTVRWWCLNPLVKIESAYFRVKWESSLWKRIDVGDRRLAMSLFVAAGMVSLCISLARQSAAFFLPLPSTHSRSAAGGRSSFINNQCASYTICQHVCDVCVFPTLQRGSLPLPSLLVKQDGVAAPRGSSRAGRCSLPTPSESSRGHFFVFFNCCTPGADFLAA